MSTLSFTNNRYQLEDLPNDIILEIFSPKQIGCILPYVSKLFNQLANNNDLWNSIAIKYRTKHLKLDFSFDVNNAKLSYIMRNIEISKLFPKLTESKIFKYNVCYDFDSFNHYLYRAEGERVQEFWSTSTLKILQFMVDYCQKPSIRGYLGPFISDDKAIAIIMKDYHKLLEKEYIPQKALIERIDLSRFKNNKPIPEVMNKGEKLARSIVSLYEKALQIYKAQQLR